MNVTSAAGLHQAPTFTPTTDPSTLVGRWVRLVDDRTEHIGVLLRAARGGRGGEWAWELRTPFEVVSGTGRPSIEPLARQGGGGARQARRRLRALRADLAELAPVDDARLSEARELVTEDLDVLELELAARP